MSSGVGFRLVSDFGGVGGFNFRVLVSGFLVWILILLILGFRGLGFLGKALTAVIKLQHVFWAVLLCKEPHKRKIITRIMV